MTLEGAFSDPPQNTTDEFEAISGRGLVILSPYWSNNDIRINGNVEYAVYDASSPNPATAQKITGIAQSITNVTESTFNADWMLLVEWRNVRPFPAGSGSPPTLPYTAAYVASVSLHTIVHWLQAQYGLRQYLLPSPFTQDCTSLG